MKPIVTTLSLILSNALSSYSFFSLQELIEYAEETLCKCTALTIEIRPNHVSPSHLPDMVEYGCIGSETSVQRVCGERVRDINLRHMV